MTIEVHKIGVGDTLTPLAFQCKQKDANGALSAVNLTGLTPKFTMTNSVGGAVVTEATTGVAVTDAASGKGTYTFQPADVVAAGTFYGWVTVWNGTSHDTYPADGRKLVIEISPRS